MTRAEALGWVILMEIDLAVTRSVSALNGLHQGEAKEMATCKDRSRGTNQFVQIGTLNDVTAGTGGQHAVHLLPAAICRVSQDLYLRNAEKNLSSGLGTVQVGHANINQHQVRLQLDGLGDGLAGTGCLTRYLELGGALESVLNLLARQRLVIANKNAV